MMVDKVGGYTKHYPSNFEGEIFEISEKYKKKGVPLVVIAGKEYGTGSSWDWACAEGTPTHESRNIVRLKMRK